MTDSDDDARFLPPAERLADPRRDPRSAPKFEVRVTEEGRRTRTFVNKRLVGLGLLMLAFNLGLYLIGTVWPYGWAIGIGLIVTGVFVGEA